MSRRPAGRSRLHRLPPAHPPRPAIRRAVLSRSGPLGGQRSARQSFSGHPDGRGSDPANDRPAPQRPELTAAPRHPCPHGHGPTGRAAHGSDRPIQERQGLPGRTCRAPARRPRLLHLPAPRQPGARLPERTRLRPGRPKAVGDRLRPEGLAAPHPAPAPARSLRRGHRGIRPGPPSTSQRSAVRRLPRPGHAGDPHLQRCDHRFHRPSASRRRRPQVPQQPGDAPLPQRRAVVRPVRGTRAARRRSPARPGRRPTGRHRRQHRRPAGVRRRRHLRHRSHRHPTRRPRTSHRPTEDRADHRSGRRSRRSGRSRTGMDQRPGEVPGPHRRRRPS